jgi:hypothetical protein
MAGEKIRDLPLNESPSDSAFTYIVDGLGGDGKINKSALREWLNLSKSQVTLIKDGAILNYTPSEDTNTAREAALRDALGNANSTSFVHLGPGNYRVSDSSPLIDSVLEASYGVKIHFSEGAAILYDDPEDASMDYILYDGPRNVKNFGAVTSTTEAQVDCHEAFQAAFNSLDTIYPDPVIELESGRILRTGRVVVPSGIYFWGGKVFWSPTVEVVGDGTNSTQIVLMNNTFDGAGDEVIMFECDRPVSADINNLFFSSIEGITFSGNHATNSRASGISIIGGQGTRMVGVFSIFFARRNAIAQGCSFYNSCTFVDAQRGPNLDWTGGGYADILSVDHCNSAGTTDPDTGRVYPAMRMKSGLFHIGLLIGEEVSLGDGSANPQTLAEAVNVLGATINQIGMGVLPDTTRNHTLLRVTGTSQNVAVTEFTGFQSGYFTLDIGTLVNDDSVSSPAGSGVPYIITTTTGSYSQRSGRGVPGLDLNNTFTGVTTFGVNTNFTVGIRVLSSLGQVDIVGGAYSTTRTTSYFNFANPVPHDWNNGKMTLTASGNLYTAGGYNVQLIDGDPEVADIPNGFRKTIYNSDIGEIRDWVNISGTLYKSAAYTAA